LGNYSYGDVTALASGALAGDRDGYRREFVSLVALARSLTPPRSADEGKMSQISQ
jgi:hypothetical protein